jgi:hypothetical protein
MVTNASSAANCYQFLWKAKRKLGYRTIADIHKAYATKSHGGSRVYDDNGCNVSINNKVYFLTL